MKKISLPEATDKIDDAYIERAIEIDSAEKLRQAMFTERMKKNEADDETTCHRCRLPLHSDGGNAHASENIG